MALTGSFGLPPPRRPGRREEVAAQQSSINFRRVLSAVVRQGDLTMWLPIAVADSDQQLEDFFRVWLHDPRNRSIFLGQTRVTLTPDLS